MDKAMIVGGSLFDEVREECKRCYWFNSFILRCNHHTPRECDESIMKTGRCIHFLEDMKLLREIDPEDYENRVKLGWIRGRRDG